MSKRPGVRVGAPVARPHAVWCIGTYDAAHAAESGSALPEVPILFSKTPNTVLGPNDDNRIPGGSTKTDWEVELPVLIRAAGPLPEIRTLRYTLPDTRCPTTFPSGNSSWNSRGQWSTGKCCESFNPTGPALAPADELNAEDLTLRSFVNGEIRQDSGTADLTFGIDDLVWYLSQFAVLERVDIINTGPPEGVALSGRFPFLRVGDVVEVEIEGIGKARQACSDG